MLARIFGTLVKRIGLRSNIRLSGVLVEMSWITRYPTFQRIFGQTD